MSGGGKGQGRGLETARYVKDMGAANGVVWAYVCVSLCMCVTVCA